MIPCCISFSLHSYRFFSFRLSSWKLCTTQYCMSMYTLEWLDFCAILIFWPRLRDVSTYSVFAICGRARLMKKEIWSKILANWNNSQTFKLRTKESLKTFQTERHLTLAPWIYHCLFSPSFGISMLLFVVDFWFHSCCRLQIFANLDYSGDPLCLRVHEPLLS